MSYRKILLLAMGTVVFFGSSAFAGGGEAESKDGGLKLKGGFYERIRHEYWKNWRDMNNATKDNRNFFRIKTSIWGKADFTDYLSLYGKLTNEFRAYPYYGGTTTDKTIMKKGYHFDINEVVFDNLYADIKKVLNAPVDLRVGRQDLMGQYGEDFLFNDGTPNDGSRTFYFNAVKASWAVDDENTLDFLYINNPRTDDILPIINPTNLVVYTNPGLDKARQSLNTTDEEAYVLYWKNKGLVKDLNLESYYILKKEDNEGGTGYQALGSTINTMGAYAKYKMGTWALRSQLAGQFGTYDEETRSAIGGYTYFDKDFPDTKFKPKASIGYIHLSGNNPGTTTNEGWDPLFSRYPFISELYSLSMASETGILCYWTNLGAVRTSLVLQPTEKSKLSFWYNYMRAVETVPASAIFTGDDKSRGHLVQGKFDYAFNKNVSTYVLLEYLFPGDMYVDRDRAMFIRSQLEIKF